MLNKKIREFRFLKLQIKITNQNVKMYHVNKISIDCFFLLLLLFFFPEFQKFFSFLLLNQLKNFIRSFLKHVNIISRFYNIQKFNITNKEPFFFLSNNAITYLKKTTHGLSCLDLRFKKKKIEKECS
jgi:hypothetical protein